MIIPALLFQLMIFLSSAIAKPYCSSSCGKISIPFPFGIETDCYIDHRYAINCSSSKPFLSSNNLEVLAISLETSTMVVNHPVLSSCQEQGTKESVNLQYTPFFFSGDKNRFTGVGCNNFASMNSRSTDSIISGCLSLCDKSNNTAEMMSCCGIKCCQSRIPSSLDLQVFDTSVSYINYDQAEKQNKCKYAFLVQKEWFENSMSPDKVEGLDHVPVVLDWGIDGDLADQLGRNSSSTSSCRFFANSRHRFFSIHYAVSKCYCSKDYEGNPYLFSGCHVIDECQVKNGTNRCGPQMLCSNTDGNFYCYPSEHSHPKSKVTMVILGLGIGFAALILLVGVWWLRIKINKRKEVQLKEKYFKRNGGLLLEQQLTSFDGSVDKGKLYNSKELDKATDHFNVNRILGKGGQGTVYKGMLTDGRIVAVKKSMVVDEGKLKEFVNEVAILSQINHRNVVKLLGCCLETEIPLLVYEFIPNGTLFQYMHDQTDDEFPLTWEMRLQIAAEVAAALYYLHSAASFPIYHRDIKSTNILLDDKYRAKVADFGTSRSIAIDQTHVTTKVQGTFGYLDPEFFQSGQFTDKSDVYSFGVILVELLTRKKPISSTSLQDNRGLSLATLFISSMVENNLFDILDPEVIKLGKKEDIMSVANLAKRCLNLNGKKRPTMKEVALVLEGIHSLQKGSNIQQNCDEVEYMRTELIEPWDVLSSSTGSTFEITVQPVDVKPLLSTM